ncbi:MAG TPA: hypothetical protein VGM96_01105 [Reyranella sp.]|jgi:hypothetical protein
MRIGRPRIVMDSLLWVSTTFAVLVGSRLLSLAIPSEYYFTFQSLFSDRPSQKMVIAVLGKMFAPALVGFIAGWLLDVATRQSDGVNRHASLARRLRQRWSPSVFLGAFSAAFISAWPMIVYWDLLANPEVAHLKMLFFALYLIYMFAFGYVALLGLLAAVFIREQLRADPDAKKVVSASELSRVGALWLLHSGIASVVLDAITK